VSASDAAPPPTPCTPSPVLRRGRLACAVFGTWTCGGPDPVVIDGNAYAAVQAGGCLSQCLLLGEHRSSLATALYGGLLAQHIAVSD